MQNVKCKIELSDIKSSPETGGFFSVVEEVNGNNRFSTPLHNAH